MVGTSHPTRYVKDTATKYHICASLPFQLCPSVLLSIKKGHRPTVSHAGLPRPSRIHSAGRHPLWGTSYVQHLCVTRLSPFGLVVIRMGNAQDCTRNSTSHVGTALCHYIGVLLLLCLCLSVKLDSMNFLFKAA